MKNKIKTENWEKKFLELQKKQCRVGTESALVSRNFIRQTREQARQEGIEEGIEMVKWSTEVCSRGRKKLSELRKKAGIPVERFQKSKRLTGNSKRKKRRMNKIKLVIAGNYQQYKLWFEFHKNLKGYEDCRYIDKVEKLYGYRAEQVEIVLEGEYWTNPAYESPRLQLLTKDLIVVKPKKGGE